MPSRTQARGTAVAAPRRNRSSVRSRTIGVFSSVSIHGLVAVSPCALLLPRIVKPDHRITTIAGATPAPARVRLSPASAPERHDRCQQRWPQRVTPDVFSERECSFTVRSGYSLVSVPLSRLDAAPFAIPRPDAAHVRSVVCAICSRQLKPSATISVSFAASRTAGSSARSPQAMETS